MQGFYSQRSSGVLVFQLKGMAGDKASGSEPGEGGSKDLEQCHSTIREAEGPLWLPVLTML